MDQSPVTPGFRPRRHERGLGDRIPPGQHLTPDFPVLSAGPTPHIKPETWSLTLEAGASGSHRWTWAEFEALPQTKVRVDIHCVTKWSKLDTEWQGVTFDDLLQAAGLSEPPAAYVMAESQGGYTTNLPVADLMAGAMVATRYDGAPLEPAHGGPARLLVPHLYFWKSAKWLTGLRFMSTDQRGFWEARGYHNYGDPWQEQRYDGD
jgi:DMSO/TMAO reductase YedYZ molybdopterin-dependent catalytic subunit